MATGESQKQLLMLIRDFATEKSQGERRVSDLKKRLLDLQAESDAATLDLENAKRSRETAEQQLKGSQVQLAMTDASIIAQEARISLLQEEISKVGSKLAELKSKEGVQRDEFIVAMTEFNRKIRQFHETTAHVFQEQHSFDLSSDNGKKIINKGKVLDMQGIIKGVEDKMTSVSAEIHRLEGEYQRELQNHDEVCQQLSDLKKRGFLVEAVAQETKELQELARQTIELEKAYAAAGEELQQRYRCPSCQLNNMDGAIETE